MMRHVKFFAVIAIGLYVVNNYETEMDRLMNTDGVAYVEGAGIREITVGSGRHDHTADIVKGTYTVMYFHSDSCHGSKLLHSQLPKFLKVRPDIAVRKYDLGPNWSGDAAYNKYGLRVGSTPFVLVYGPDGELVAADNGREQEGFKFLYKWMNAELRKAWEQKHAS